MIDEDRQANTRWFREPFAWLVFALPAAAVLASLVTVAIAIATDDGVVADDYYKRGLEINKRLVREDAAVARGLAVNVVMAQDGHFQLELRGPADTAFPALLAVTFAHATRGGSDRQLTVEHLGRGLYRGHTGTLPPGPWHVDVSTPQWRLVQRIVLPQDGG